MITKKRREERTDGEKGRRQKNEECKKKTAMCSTSEV